METKWLSDAYSAIGLTKDKLDLTAFEHCFKFLCKNPLTECALLASNNRNMFIPAEITCNGNT